MKVAPAAGGEGIRVTFKNGVTVPRGSKGRHARILGTIRVVEQKASFLASGVELAGGSN